MPEAAAPQDFPVLRKCPFEPPPEFKEMASEAPLVRIKLYNGQLAWLITSYEESLSLLTDNRFSSDRRHPGFPMVLPMPDEARQVRNLVTMDPPEHTTRRRMLISAFSMHRMRTLRPQLQQICDELIDQMQAKGNSGDLVSDFALPMASTGICQLLGVPQADRVFFEDRSRNLVAPDDPAAIGAAYMELSAYVSELVDKKKEQLEDDLTSELVVSQLEPGHIERTELVDLALLLLAAGHATTAAMISIGTALLLENPDQLAMLRADQALIPGAVDELLRYLTVADLTTPRVALADVEIGGETIRAGEGVISALSTANRDPKVFDRPDELDVTRTARGHIAFGHGAHQCIGANLSRVELEVAYETLFRRFPDLRLTKPADQLAPSEGTLFPEIRSLPVAW